METIRLIGYNPCSVADGEGLREVLYVSQCTHACEGCQNQKYWKEKGDEYLIDDVVEKVYKNPLTDITISGGDGLTIQYKDTLNLCKKLKLKGDKNIWLYTGYKYEDLFMLGKSDILNYIDILVDGKFQLDKKDSTLPFKGSSNQRIVNVKESFKRGNVVIWKKNGEI